MTCQETEPDMLFPGRNNWSPRGEGEEGGGFNCNTDSVPYKDPWWRQWFSQCSPA